MTIATPPTAADAALLTRIADRALAQMLAMIRIANDREKLPGDPKVGGHPASCASSLHVLTALHLAARRPQDLVCCKPHASPMDHAFHHLLGLFRHPDGRWYEEREAKALMTRLRKFPTPDEPDVFQSYHARTDPDSFHMLPTGSVGIPPVVSVYLALAYRYAHDHGHEVPADAHFWSLMGDSEFREGSLLEAMPDAAERLLGNVTWIVDYNRQNLDGTRITNERGLESRDCDRIERTALANGWKVIQVRHGALREKLFAKRQGGAALRELFETGLSDYELQHLLFDRDAAQMRAAVERLAPRATTLVQGLSDEDVVAAFRDLGGHDVATMARALETSRDEENEPYLIVAHTAKGWGLECYADPSNHSTVPSEAEVESVLARVGLTPDDAFATFDPTSDEGAFLAARGAEFRRAIEEHGALRERNRRVFRARVAEAGGLPDSLGIDTSLFPMAHTQWMWGQVAGKLVRIGTPPGSGAPGAPERELDENELRWKPAAELVLTLSPDVGTSTNISPILDRKIYGPQATDDVDDRSSFEARHPELLTSLDAATRHIRFEIVEANCMSAAGAFGKMGHFVGIPLFPVMTVYDFFIKRALDQLYYNLYWGCEFVILGTPSGVTLSPEGAQHSWKSDIQIPNLVSWEPLFAIEVDWILADAIRRHMDDDNEGRRGVLVRGVTRGVRQALLLEHVRRQAASKTSAPDAPLAPAGSGWSDGVDESTLAPLPDAELLARVRADCLRGAYRLVDWRGYAGYEPGDNVVEIFAMGSVATEALEASAALLERGVFANLTVVTSPDLLLGILAEADDYLHLREGLGVSGDLFAVADAARSEAGLVGLAGRRVPCVAVCDGEAGLVDNVGSIVGVKQRTLAVRRFSKSGRPDEVFAYQGLDRDSIVEACGRMLAETALEDFVVAPALLERMAARGGRPRPHWRELWPTSRDA